MHHTRKGKGCTPFNPAQQYGLLTLSAAKLRAPGALRISLAVLHGPKR
jgi:hypothetical protein